MSNTGRQPARIEVEGEHPFNKFYPMPIHGEQIVTCPVSKFEQAVMNYTFWIPKLLEEGANVTRVVMVRQQDDDDPDRWFWGVEIYYIPCEVQSP